MKRRMAFLMSMALTVNAFSVTPAYATDEFTDTEVSASEISADEENETFGDGTEALASGEEAAAAVTAGADEEGKNEDAGQIKAVPVITASKETIAMGWSSYLVLSCDDSEYISGITQVKVKHENEEEQIWKECNKSTFLFSGQYYKEDNKIGFDGYQEGVLKLNDIITVQSTGYQELVLKVTGVGDNFAVEVVISDSGEQLTPPSVTGENVDDFNCSYSVINITDTGYFDKITEIAVDESAWRKASSTMALWGSGAYYLDTENHRIMFDSTGLAIGNVITIKSEGYQDLFLKVTATGTDFAVAPKDSGASDINGPSNGITTLHVRLTGYFESALTGQKGYDAVTGASTSASVNKNSYVTVEAADIPDGEEPTESDWKPLSDTIRINAQKTTANIDTENSGMEARYSVYDSSLTLSGTPKTPGTYPVSVTVTDESGRTAQSNEIEFKVYGTEEKLADHLKLENAVQTSDGKYLYDMDPWAIPYFGGENETVTVPADIKAWYGSHTSGTYGELGYAVRDLVPVQTLVIPAGCNLTMVNMKVLSSVKIVVEDGAKFTVRDSSIDGQIEVMNGGTLSVDYDDYNNEFLTGACINGQIILNDGAVLENAVIHSNTNYLANGEYDRHNSNPVVVVNGNATIKGEVYIRGDEAPAIGSGYSGQPALKISNAALNIEKGAVLGVYGGGQYALSYDGGDALILDNGEVSGQGTLIAVAGRGFFGNGGNGVSGNGKIAVSGAYLEGGSPTSPDKNSGPGKAYASGVDVSETARINAVDGRAITDPADSAPDTYWGDITEKPDISNCTIPEMTEEQKVTLAKSAITEAIDSLTVSNDTSEDEVRKAIEDSLEQKKQTYTEMSNIVVDIVVEKVNAVAGKDGSVKITVTIKNKENEKELDVVEQIKTIEKLPEPSKPTEPSKPDDTLPPTPTATPIPTATPMPTATPAPVPDTYPNGTVGDKDGNYTTPNGTVIQPDGTIVLPNGDTVKPDADGNKPSVDKEENVTDTNGTVIAAKGDITLSVTSADGKTIQISISAGTDGARPEYDQKNCSVTTVEESVISRPGLKDLTAGKGWNVKNDGTVTDTDGNVYYMDGSVTDSTGSYIQPSKEKIETAYVKQNGVKVELSDDCKGAQGYDYVIGTSSDLLETKKYAKVVKNQVSSQAAFSYMEQGTWYVACHAWTRGADGKKVFGEWSEVKEVEVTSVTPETPQIEKITVKGTTVTVTYTVSENAQGYDVVLGSRQGKVNDEKRPLAYGKYVKKMNGNKLTVTFTNVKPGTYYAGLHTWNRSSEDNSKVFSKWSDVERFKLK